MSTGKHSESRVVTFRGVDDLSLVGDEWNADAPADRPAVIERAGRLRSLETNMGLIAAMNALEHDCFTLQYGPVAPQWTTHETMAAIADEAELRGLMEAEELRRTQIETQEAEMRRSRSRT